MLSPFNKNQQTFRATRAITIDGVFIPQGTILSGRLITAYGEEMYSLTFQSETEVLLTPDLIDIQISAALQPITPRASKCHARLVAMAVAVATTLAFCAGMWAPQAAADTCELIHTIIDY